MTGVPETHSIVIVDDVPEIREIIRFLLEESGWFRVVGEAGTGEDAVEVVTRLHPDLLLLDLDLREVSGWDVLPDVHDQAPDTAVVVLSPEPANRMERRSVESFASAVLEKGVSNRHLINTLLEVAGRDRLTSTARPNPAALTQPTVEDATAAIAREPAGWLAALIASSHDAIVATSLDGTVLAWSPAAAQLFGYTAGEIVGRHARVLVPADRPDEERLIAGLVAKGERIDGYETVRLHKNGARVDVQLNAVPAMGLAGDTIGVVTMHRDVTSRRQTDAALARAIVQLDRRNRDLSRSNQELDSFAAVASHDLSQPLQVAYGFLDMIRSDLGSALPEHGRMWLDRSIESLERLRHLVGDILRYARTGSGDPKLEPVALGPLAREAISRVEAAVRERGADISVAGGLPTVLGDRDQLVLVLQNLLVNGIKFVPLDRRPRIEITGEYDGADVVLRVADNGVGVPPDERDKVWEMFQRSDVSRRVPGTGLGLAIVKKIVIRHGGSAWVTDGLAGGAAVCLRLPAAPSDADSGSANANGLT